MKMVESTLGYYESRVINLLGNSDGGCLTKWKIVRRAIRHLDEKTREALLSDMVKQKLVQKFTIRQVKRAGPPAEHFVLTDRGWKEFKKFTSQSPNGEHLQAVS